MTRRSFLSTLLAATTASASAAENLLGTLKKSAEHWKPLVSAAAWNVLFKEDTERPGTSALLKEKREGTFVCAACHHPLFDSTAKYESGTGWPSFWKALPGGVATKTDYKIVFQRTEYHCARCGGHQGHVFDDGPEPTGQRYCNNGLALAFAPKGETLELRS